MIADDVPPGASQSRVRVGNVRRSLIRLVFTLALGVGLAHAAVVGAYRLGIGDAIHITVFQNPDLTLDTQVSSAGTITFPLIGTVKIGGRTVAGAEQVIANALRVGKFVRNPSVNIDVVQIRGSQFSVLGYVNRPGRFPLETMNTRVADALAEAGGIAADGANTVILTGTRDGKPFRKVIDVGAMFRALGSQDDILVAPGDVLYVEREPFFYIYGEVQRPGQYRIERGMTVMQALAEGGGPTPRGSDRGVRLDRGGPDGKIIEFAPKLTDPVQNGDVIRVPEAIF